MSEGLTVQCMSGAQAAERGLLPGVEKIFFDAAAREYVPGPERDAFRERWLGRYLAYERDILLIGLTERDEVWGYLVGTTENAAESERFADTSYFHEEFLEVCRLFPAHLHINLDASYRNLGLGARLIRRFAQYVSEAGVSGMHVVTGASMRNVRFYERCGFAERARALRNGRELVFLGAAV